MNTHNIPAFEPIVQSRAFGDIVAGVISKSAQPLGPLADEIHEIAFTLLAKDAGTFSKTFAVGPAGSPIKARDSDRAADSASRITLTGTAGIIAQDFASRLRGIRANEALVLAPPPAGRDVWPVMLKKELGERTDAIARSKEHLRAPSGPAIMGLDFDAKEWPAPVVTDVRHAGGVLRVLESVFPHIADAVIVRRPSVSCGILNTETGQQTALDNGAHWYFLVTVGAEIQEFARRLHDRLVLAGFGFGFVDKAGHVHIRSLIDEGASIDASRLWYEADAELTDPRLRYVDDARAIRIENTTGGLLDLSRLPALSAEEEARRDQIRGEIEKKHSSQAAIQRKVWQKERYTAAIARGVDPSKAKRIAGSATAEVLFGEFELKLDDGAMVSVDEILDDPTRYHEVTCPDPLEPDYGAGRNLAKIFTDRGNIRLYSHAHGGTLYYLSRSPEHWLDDPGSDEPLFPVADPRSQPGSLFGGSEQDVFPTMSIDELLARKPPVYLVEGMIPERSVGFIYGAPGTFKTFIALDMALTIATGLGSWHGQTVHAEGGAPVLYIAAEGASGLGPRIGAWLRQHEVAVPPAAFRILGLSVDFTNATQVEKLLRTIRKDWQRQRGLIVLDTVSRALPGADENLQAAMSLFVHALTRISEEFECAVIGVHHANAENSRMRGSTVLQGAGDFVFRIVRDERSRPILKTEMICEKQKDAPDGWTRKFTLAPIECGNGQSSLVPLLHEEPVGSADADTPSKVWRAMASAWEAGTPWQTRTRGTRTAPANPTAVDRIVSDFELLRPAAEQLIADWLANGSVMEDVFDARGKRKGLRPMRRPPDNPSELPGEADTDTARRGVFE